MGVVEIIAILLGLLLNPFSLIIIGITVHSCFEKYCYYKYGDYEDTEDEFDD